MQAILIKKSKICWYITANSAVAFDNIQATSYNAFGAINGPIHEMVRRVKESRPDEYNSWADIVDLATKVGIIGYGTRVKPEWIKIRDAIQGKNGSARVGKAEAHKCSEV